MDIDFECDCSDVIAVQTNHGSSGDVRVPCDTCGAIYAVSITKLIGSDERR